MSEFGTLQDRVERKALLDKVMTAEQTIQFFKPGMNLGWSGFTPAGYPKAVPIALADHVEANNLQGQMKFNLFIGASVGAETEDRWATLDMIDRRWPYQTGKNIAKGINSGKIRMGDKHLGVFAQDIGYGFYTENGRIDVAIIEVSAVKADCGLILTSSCGIVPELVKVADKIILEVNTGQPSFEGMHDIIMSLDPPNRQPCLITKANDRVGTQSVPCDPDKIIAVVESKHRDKGRAFTDMDATSEAIASHIMDFFSNEVKRGRLPENLLPLQSGVGSIANAVVGGLAKGPFKNLTVYTEVLQDTMLDLFDSGKLDFASSCSLSLSEDPGFPRFFANWDKYADKITLRPLSISNAPEPIRRLGCIAMNTPVEFDMYAHANSTLVGGTRMINGLGGSGDFLRNGFLKIMHAPSTRPTKTDPNGITCVVPKAPHIDHTEHDLDVLVTEQGLADLRGLAPKDRAQLIIDKCVHPEYKPIIQEYFDMAKEECLAKGIGHEPQLFDRCFKMQLNLAKNGTMKIDNWDI
ncbi:MAG TPA: acetyl-CoA hydrolase/transferase C-terminal domain-containing protein [Geopsychrobacteraceae bacterium]|jgi:acetyl-CoA hydrolase